jgi:hypothetical protein
MGLPLTSEETTRFDALFLRAKIIYLYRGYFDFTMPGGVTLGRNSDPCFKRQFMDEFNQRTRKPVPPSPAPQAPLPVS